MDIGDDHAYSKFFGTSFVDETKRIYTDKRSFPTYQVGSKVHINGHKYLPGIYGTISRENAGATEVVKEFEAQKEEFEMELNACGLYYADLYTNKPDRTGQFIHYEFYFYIEDWTGNYKPSVNEEILKTANRVTNYQNKIYCYKVDSQGPGKFLYSFPWTPSGYSDAINFAADAEYRNVELIDNYYYYNGNFFENNLDGKIALSDEIYKNVENLVETKYILPNEPLVLTSTTKIDDVLNTYIDNDIYVTPNENTRRTLLTKDCFLNNFVFQQVAPYESDKVQIIAEDGTTYDIEYGKPVDDYLTKTGMYKIVESNWCGTNVYYANYINGEDNTSILKVKFYYSEETKYSEISQNSTGYAPTPCLFLESAYDDFDSQSMLKITKGDEVILLCLLSEINNFELSSFGSGIYNLYVTNRFGNEFGFMVSITERPENYDEIANELKNSECVNLSRHVFDGQYDNSLYNVKPLETYDPTWFFYASAAVAGVGLVAFILTKTIKSKRRYNR